MPNSPWTLRVWIGERHVVRTVPHFSDVRRMVMALLPAIPETARPAVDQSVKSFCSHGMGWAFHGDGFSLVAQQPLGDPNNWIRDLTL